MPSPLTQVEPCIYKYKIQRGQRYCVRIKLDGQDHRERGLRSIEEARRYLRQALSMESGGGGDITIGDYAEEWLAQNKTRWKTLTFKSYQFNLNKYILPEFGAKKFSQFSRRHLRAWLTMLTNTEGLAPNSIRLALAPLSALMSQAVEDGLIDTNACFRPGRIVQLRNRKRRPQSFSEKEELAIYEACRKHFPDSIGLILTLFQTAVRIGEAFALESKDVDFTTDHLNVTKNWNHLGILEHSTKTDDHGMVYLERSIRSVLKRETKKKKTGPLFPNGYGGHFNYSNWRSNVWIPLLEKAKVRYLNPHCTRHTYATRRLEDGKSLIYVSRQLRHETIQMTIDLYGHVRAKKVAKSGHRI